MSCCGVGAGVDAREFDRRVEATLLWDRCDKLLGVDGAVVRGVVIVD